MHLMTIKRIILVGGLATGILCLVGSVILWVVLSSWIPANGKTFLIRTIEQQAPVHVSIHTLRYEPLRGFVLENVRVADRDSQELWLSTPRIGVQVQWLSLLLGGNLAFHAQAPIDTPCHANLSLLGRYHLRTKSLTLDVRMSDISLSTLAAPLRRHVPSARRWRRLRLPRTRNAAARSGSSAQSASAAWAWSIRRRTPASTASWP